MKRNKQTGEQYCETRQELADKYFDIGTGQEGLGIYAIGNMGIVTLMSDLQHHLAQGFVGDEGGANKEYWRKVLNDVKCVLITDSQNEAYHKAYDELAQRYSNGALQFIAFEVEVKKLKQEHGVE